MTAELPGFRRFVRQGLVVQLGQSVTNTFRGTVFAFFRHDRVDAHGYFDPRDELPRSRQNQFGGAFGGPIRRGRT